MECPNCVLARGWMAHALLASRRGACVEPIQLVAHSVLEDGRNRLPPYPGYLQESPIGHGMAYLDA